MNQKDDEEETDDEENAERWLPGRHLPHITIGLDCIVDEHTIRWWRRWRRRIIGQLRQNRIGLDSHQLRILANEKLLMGLWNDAEIVLVDCLEESRLNVGAPVYITDR